MLVQVPLRISALLATEYDFTERIDVFLNVLQTSFRILPIKFVLLVTNTAIHVLA